jgi:hypothetical protein
MKKAFILFSIVFLIIILSVGITDGLSTFSNDINSHLLTGLAGRWECRENSHYYITFNSNGTFSEYYYGMNKGSGIYDAYGNSVTLYYNEMICKSGPDNICMVHMRLYYKNNSTILENLESKKSFTKSNAR